MAPGNGGQPSSAASLDALCSPVKICEPLLQPLVHNVKEHVERLLQNEKNEEKRMNIQAFLAAYKGEEIGHDELFCKGKRMNIDDWQPEMGPYFALPLSRFTIYNQTPGTVAQQTILFDITSSDLDRGTPTGPVMRIYALHDTGSDLPTLYHRDLCTLDPYNHFANALGEVIPIRTTNRIVHRQRAIGSAQLVKVDGAGYLGNWFREVFSVNRRHTCLRR